MTREAVIDRPTYATRRTDKSLTRKASLNALATGLEVGARLIVGFLLNPLLIEGLGAFLFGVWKMLGSMVGYLSAAGGRPSQALKWTIASKQASSDADDKRRCVGSAVAVWLLFLPIVTPIGGLLAWWSPSLLGASSDVAATVRLSAGMLVVNLLLSGLAGIPRSVLQGVNLGYKRMGVTTILIFVGGGLTALALHLNLGLLGVVASQFITTLLTGLVFLYFVRRYTTWFAVAKPSRGDVGRFFQLSGWFLIWRLITRLMSSGDVVLLGLLVSVETVSVYALTKYIPQLIGFCVTVLVGGIMPGLGGIVGAGKLERAAGVRREIMTATWLITTVLGITVLLFNRSFVQLWVGAEFYAGTIPAACIMLMVIQSSYIRNDANIIDLNLKLREKVLLGLLSIFVALATATALVVYLDLGIIGICLGFVLGRLILTISYPLMVGKLLGISTSSQIGGLLRPVAVVIPLFGAALWLSPSVELNTWIGLVVSMGTTVILAGFLVFHAGLSNSQRMAVWHRLSQLAGTSPA